jgi:hypothetical protein
LTLTIVWSAALCLSFVIGANVASPYPVFAATAILGAALVGLPLRRFRLAAPLGVLAWLGCAVAVSFALGEGSTADARITTAAIGVTVVAWVISFAWFAYVREGSDEALISIAGATFITCIAVAIDCVVVIGIASLPGHDRFFVVPPDLRPSLTTVAVLAPIAAAVVAIVAGLLRAVDDERAQPGDWLPTPPSPRPVKRPRGTRRTTFGAARDPGTIVLRALAIFVDEVGVAARLIAILIMQGLRWLVHWFLRGLVLVGNLLWRWVYQSVMIVVEGAVLSIQAVRMSVRVVAVPIGCFLIAAFAALSFARHDLDYLITGSLQALGLLFAHLLVATVALTAAWIALSREPMSRALRSAGLTLSNFGARLVIVVAVGGWIVGLYGYFGDGPIRVGWVTFGATLILILSATISAIRNRGDSGGESVEPERDKAAAHA